MLGNRNNSLAVVALMAAAGMGVASGGASVVPRDSYSPGYRKGRRSMARPDEEGYPGAKLAKKARKGTLTHNGIR
jgi:DNA-binding transcriptional LysR family regulator